MTFRRRFFFPLIAGLTVILEIGVLVFLIERKDLTDRVQANLGRAIDVSVATLDPNAIISLKASSQDVQSLNYTDIRSQLFQLERIFSSDGIRGLYLMRVTSSTVFLADSASTNDPWHSEPGVMYHRPPPAVSLAALSGRRQFTAPYADEYGNYYSIFDVIKDSTGGVIAVIGADVETKAYDLLLFQEVVPSALILLLLAVVYASILYSVLKFRETVSLLREEGDEMAEKNAELAREKAASEENSARLAVLIEQLPVGVLIIDPKKGRPTLANQRVVDILGREIDMRVGIENYVNTYTLLTENGSPYPTKQLPADITLRSGQFSEKSDLFVHRPKDGVHALRMVAAPIRPSGSKMTAVAVVVEDKTAQYEADVRKSEFISIASHQLRTPLSAVKWFLELFSDPNNGKLNTVQKDYLREINGAVQRLVDLVNQLLNVSRLEAGTVGVAPVQTDVKELIESIASEVRPLFEEKRITFTQGRLAHLSLKIDPKLVREVLVNILSNAVKYTPEGGRVKLGAEVRKEDILISVSDTGIGVPEGQKTDIFNKFFRAENATMSGIEGTGLGLYIAKQSAEMSGGKIGFTSKEGSGSTFWFTLPLSGSIERRGQKPLEKSGDLA